MPSKDTPAPDTQPEADVYEEIADVPPGRKSRQVPAELWAKLEESAKRNVGFSRTGSEAVIEQVRRDLNSAAVRAKFEVTTQRSKADGRHRIAFGATYKVANQQ
jgi:hypothetical protein